MGAGHSASCNSCIFISKIGLVVRLNGVRILHTVTFWETEWWDPYGSATSTGAISLAGSGPPLWPQHAALSKARKWVYGRKHTGVPDTRVDVYRAICWAELRDNRPSVNVCWCPVCTSGLPRTTAEPVLCWRAHLELVRCTARHPFHLPWLPWGTRASSSYYPATGAAGRSLSGAGLSLGFCSKVRRSLSPRQGI